MALLRARPGPGLSVDTGAFSGAHTHLPWRPDLSLRQGRHTLGLEFGLEQFGVLL